MLLVWTAFASSLLFYFRGGIVLDRADAVAPQTQPTQNDDEIYTGSILVMPPYGGQCWRMLLDNRTGRMWGYGDVSCEVLARVVAESEQRGTTDAARMRAISSAFRNAGE